MPWFTNSRTGPRGSMYKLRWEYITDNKWLFIDGLVLGLKMAILGLLIAVLIFFYLNQ